MTVVLSARQSYVSDVRQTDIFITWFARLRGREARARIMVRIRRLPLGNLGDVKPVGGGMSEAACRLRPWLPGLFRPARAERDRPAVRR
jgi:hypothetical protein